MEVYAIIYDYYTEADIHPITNLLGIFSTRPKAVSVLESSGFTPDSTWQRRRWP